MQAPTQTAHQANVDWFIFIASAVVVYAVCLPLGLYPEAGGRVLDEAFQYVTGRFGVAYILFSIFAITFLLYLAFSRFGNIRLGGDAPEFSTFSWAAMLFCGGIGTSVLYWGTIEWGYYYTDPPFGEVSQSEAAMRWASSYPLFHWGFTGWAIYCLPGIASAYAYHVRGNTQLRLSAACEPIIGHYAQGWTGRVIDLVYMVGLVGATSTGIGLAVPLIAACLEALFGLQDTFALKVAVITGVTAVFAASVWVGLERGIKRLSNIAVFLAFALLVFVLMVGPTVQIIETGTATVGHMLQNYLRMSTWTDPHGQALFVETWTVFYWAWWLALGPFMGLFITKISRGRTISQVVLGSLGYGTAGCAVFFVVLGTYAAHVNATGDVAVLSMLQQDQPAAAVIAVLGTLPLREAVLVLFVIVCVIFAATSYDSASYTLASSTTRSLHADDHPARWNRVFWACTLGLLPITLIYIGGLRPLQSAVVAVSLPLLIIVLMMSAALIKSLWEDHPE